MSTGSVGSKQSVQGLAERGAIVATGEMSSTRERVAPFARVGHHVALGHYRRASFRRKRLT